MTIIGMFTMPRIPWIYISRGSRIPILEVVNTSCYLWLSSILLNLKPSRIIVQRASLSNQCTSLGILRLYPSLCDPLMAPLHTFIFPYFHSNCIATNLSVVSNNQVWRELTVVAMYCWYIYFQDVRYKTLDTITINQFGFAVDLSQKESYLP